MNSDRAQQDAWLVPVRILLHYSHSDIISLQYHLVQHPILFYILLHCLFTAYHSTHHHTLNLILSFICIILQSQLCIHIHHFHFTSINSHSYSHSFPHLPIQCNTIIYFFSSNSPSMLISLSSPSPSSLHPYNTSHLITHSNHPNPIPIPFPRPTRHETPSHHSPFLHFLSLITDSFNPPLLSYVWTFLCRN